MHTHSVRPLSGGVDSLVKSFIGPNLAEERTPKEVRLASETIRMDYGRIAGIHHRDPDDQVVLVPGFGSGWIGIAELGSYLALLGRNVTMVSLPGYGNSDDPSESYYANARDFYSEAEALACFAKEMFEEWECAGSVHWVGHSLAAAVITELGRHYPKFVGSLTLLNPAGFERKMRVPLAARFILSGALNRIFFRGETLYPRIKPFLPKERSPFTAARLSQRMSEWRRIAENSAYHALMDVPRNIPVAYMTGAKDFVFPIDSSSIIRDNLLRSRQNTIETLPLGHNTTLLGSKVTADVINEFLLSV